MNMQSLQEVSVDRLRIGERETVASLWHLLARAAIAVVLLAAASTATGPVQAATQTRTSAFDYDPVSGMLKKEVIEPDNSAMCVVTEYDIDNYGRHRAVTTRNCNGSAGSIPGAVTEAAAPGAPAAFAPRTTNTTFTADQRFDATSSNALGHTESRTYDARLGVVTGLTGPNGLTTQWAYDNFGRKLLEKRADGNGTRWAYEYCSGFGGSLACPTVNGGVGAYAVTVTPVASPIDLVAKTTGSATGPYTRTYYDVLDRAIRAETQGNDLNGSSTLIFQDTAYNAIGLVLRKSNPYFSGQTSYWTSYTYDVLGRVTSENRPTDSAASGAITSTVYNGLTVEVTDANGFKTTQILNVARQVVSRIDAKGAALQYKYDPHGNTVQTQDAAGNVVSIVYDTRGRKTAMYDPDMGVWTYTYNAAGELVSQTDAKGQTTTMAYDVLGRLTSRADPTTLVSNWHYDTYANASTCAKGIGKLCEVVSSNGHIRKHFFDGLGRPSSTSTTVGSTFTSSVSYDGLGRVDLQTYPTGLAIRNTYTAVLGFHKSVVDTRTGAALWTGNSANAAGQAIQYTFGNGVVTANAYFAGTNRLNSTAAGPGNAVQNLTHGYDAVGRLTSRVDALTNVTAGYLYDEVNRLLSETRFGGGIAGAEVISWTYDAIGNMRTRTQAGVTNTYNYNSSGSGSSRPHAVASVSGSVSGVSLPSYSYDANGNLTSGAGRTASWTGFDKVESITRGAARLEYVYDMDRERAIERYFVSGTLERTTTYLNPAAGAGLHYEEEVGAAGTKRKHYVMAGGTSVAMIVCTTAPCTSTANTTTQYWHKDHLGSTNVVTDAAGNVVERMAYEPFGKRRYSNGVTDANGILVASSTDRGYTGHEHMEEVGLINMNGRIYDPGLGRFMSADPFIQNPDNLQSYNRYSYVWNDPLNGTDPSGYISLKKFLRTVVSIAVAYYTGQWAGEWLMSNTTWGFEVAAKGTVLSTSGSVVAGAAGGFAGGVTNTGSLKGGFQGAFTGGVFGGIGATTGGWEQAGKIAAHAAGGCVTAAASGGKCGSGALAAGVGKLATLNGPEWVQNPGKDNVGRVAAAAAYIAVVGGTASRIAGGKFENGAVTAAFGYLFNQMTQAARAGAATAAGGVAAAGPSVGERIALAVDQAAARVGDVVDYIFKSDSVVLARNMVQETDLSREPGQHAHHIVAANDPRADPARTVLGGVGMSINSAFNGVFLNPSQHAQIHTNVYYNAVNLGLTGATTYADVALRLTAMRAAIQAGMFPR